MLNTQEFEMFIKCIFEKIRKQYIDFPIAFLTCTLVIFILNSYQENTKLNAF